MWAVSEGHAEVVRLLIHANADLDARSRIYPVADAPGSEGPEPEDADPEARPRWRTRTAGSRRCSSRHGKATSPRRGLLLAAGADVNAVASDGKGPLSMAIYNGNYELASFLVDHGADVDEPDAAGFPPLFWAVDRRNMEWNPGFPWTVTADPLPLIRKLLDAGADPNHYVDADASVAPQLRWFAAHPVRHGIDAGRLLRGPGAGAASARLRRRTRCPVRRQRDAAAGRGPATAGSDGYSQGKPFAERLDVIKLLVELGGRRQLGRRRRHHALDGGRQHGRRRHHPVPGRPGRGPRGARPGQEERRRVRRQHRAADAHRLRHRGRHVPAQQRHRHDGGGGRADDPPDGGARHRTHHLRVHAAGLHLWRHRSDGGDAGRDRTAPARSRSATAWTASWGGLAVEEEESADPKGGPQ